jgi:hypothetical protein
MGKASQVSAELKPRSTDATATAKTKCGVFSAALLARARAASVEMTILFKSFQGEAGFK